MKGEEKKTVKRSPNESDFEKLDVNIVLSFDTHTHTVPPKAMKAMKIKSCVCISNQS